MPRSAAQTGGQTFKNEVTCNLKVKKAGGIPYAADRLIAYRLQLPLSKGLDPKVHTCLDKVDAISVA